MAKLSKESVQLLSNRPCTSQPYFFFPLWRVHSFHVWPADREQAHFDVSFAKQSKAPSRWDAKANSQSIQVHERVSGERTDCRGSDLPGFCVPVLSGFEKTWGILSKPVTLQEALCSEVITMPVVYSLALMGALPSFSLSFPSSYLHLYLFDAETCWQWLWQPRSVLHAPAGRKW